MYQYIKSECCRAQAKGSELKGSEGKLKQSNPVYFVILGACQFVVNLVKNCCYVIYLHFNYCESQFLLFLQFIVEHKPLLGFAKL